MKSARVSGIDIDDTVMTFGCDLAKNAHKSIVTVFSPAVLTIAVSWLT